MYLKWQMQTIIINSKLEFLFLANMLAPVELFPNREFGGIESARLLVRSVEPCRRQLVGAATHHLSGISKNHSMVSVFIVCGLILSPFITQ